MKGNELFEAIDIGNEPDYINKISRAKIERGELGYEDAVYGGIESTEKFASSQYKKVLSKVRHYFNITDRRGVPLINKLGQAMELLNSVKGIEKNHKEVLEHFAVDTVLKMPMFEKAREAYDNDELAIDVELLDSPYAAQQMMKKEKEEDISTGFDDMPDLDDLDDLGVNIEIDSFLVDDFLNEAEKVRRIQNLMIQGSATDNIFHFEKVRDELNRIDPRLADMYGKLQSVLNLGMWVTSPMMTNAQSAVGAEELEFDEEGNCTIVVKALTFPLLIHELIKGLMEYVTAKSLPEDEAIKGALLSRVDTNENELFDMMLGPVLWRQFAAAVGEENENLLVDVWNKMLLLPATFSEDLGGGFIELIKKMTKDPETARDVIHPLVQEIIQEIKNYERQMEEYERQMREYNKPVNDHSDDDDPHDDDDPYGLRKGWKDAPPDERFSDESDDEDDGWNLSGLYPESYNRNEEILLEELTRRQKELFNAYNASIDDLGNRSLGGTLNRDKLRLTEEEFEEIAKVDPTGLQMVNLPLILNLYKNGIFRNPVKDVQRIIDETTFIPPKRIEKWEHFTDNQGNARQRRVVSFEEYDEAAKERIKKRNAPKTLSWVLRGLSEKAFAYPEDLPAVHGHINFFFNNRERGNWPSDKGQDITQYKYHDLAREIAAIQLEMRGVAEGYKLEDVKPDIEFIAMEEVKAPMDDDTIFTIVDKQYQSDRNKTDKIKRGDIVRFELYRVYPTQRAQQSLSEYESGEYKDVIKWCVSFNNSGPRHFMYYLDRSSESFENLPKNLAEAKRLNDTVTLDPLESYYMIVKNGIPSYLCDFKTGNLMSKEDHESRDTEDYKMVIRNMLLQYIPGAAAVINPFADLEKINSDINYSLPSLIVKNFITKDEKAMQKICFAAAMRLTKLLHKHKVRGSTDAMEEGWDTKYGLPLPPQVVEELSERYKRDIMNSISAMVGDLDSKFINQKFTNNRWLEGEMRDISSGIGNKLRGVSRECINFFERDIKDTEYSDQAKKYFTILLRNIHKYENTKIPSGNFSMTLFNDIKNHMMREKIPITESNTLKKVALSALLATSIASAQDVTNTSREVRGANITNVANNTAINQNIIARTIYREARAEGKVGMEAVASVIYNRSNGVISKMIADIKKKKRYSCWNGMSQSEWDDFNIKTYSGKAWDTANSIAAKIVNKTFTPTIEHDHYYSIANNKRAPYWAADKHIQKDKTKDIGKHRFIKMKK